MIFSSGSIEESGNFRHRIYNGEVFKIPATVKSLSLTEQVQGELSLAFGPDFRRIHEAVPVENIWQKMTFLRQHMAEYPPYHALMREIIIDAGFMPAENVYDVLRLRAVLHNGHGNPAAAKAYSLHRDTWYGNPQAQINWWIPLHDVSEKDSFSFFPGYFKSGIKNTSADFDYKGWIANVGWQNAKGGRDTAYPRALENPEARDRKGFSCKAGDMIVFSAAQAHQTAENTTQLTRFSVDFRTVHLLDMSKGVGAPNVDNLSSPDAVDDYLRFQAGGI